MNCEQFEREWQKLDDSALLSPALEEHRQVCSPCAGKVRDVNLIRWQARQMVEAEQPPERVWLHLRRQLDQQGLIREPGAWPSLARLVTFAWLPRLPLGLAYAAVFFLALGGVLYLRDLVTHVSAPPPAPATAVAQPPATPSPAETLTRAEAVQKAIEKAPPEVRRVIEKAPPDRQPAYVANWQQLNPSFTRVDSSINVLEQYLAAHPDDPLARSQLYTVYEQQNRLLELLIRGAEFR